MKLFIAHEHRSTNHVNVEDGYTGCEVVLIEYSLELVVYQDGALVEAPSTKWIKGTTLELSLF